MVAMAAGARETRAVVAHDPGDGAGERGSPAPGSDRGVDDEVRGLVTNLLETVSRAGTLTASGMADAVEGAGRSLSRRVVTGAAEDGAPGGHVVADRRALAEALADAPVVPALGSATSAALLLKFAGRFRRFGFVVRRIPAFVIVAVVPALVASVARGSQELGMVASHLVQRARAQGVEPDLERVRRAAVQIVSHQPVDPEVEPSHGALAVRWLRRAARAALPFTAGVATADPEGLATAAAAVDPVTLGPT
jgi:hypothetical protein